jgi:LacI family transcriptional regulator
MSLPGTPPVYARIAEALKPRMATWEEGGWPTVRVVASEFKVSIVTASRALQALRTEQGAPIGEDRWAVCLHVSPGPFQQAATDVTAVGFRELALQSETTFDMDTVRLDDNPSEAVLHQRLQAVAAAGVRGLFLLPSRVSDDLAQRDERLLAAAAAAKVQVILIERNLRGSHRPLTHDLVCFHDFEGGATLARHLIDQGRKRIVFVSGSDTSSHGERLGGYLSTVLAARLPPLLISQPEGATPRQAYTAIAEQVLAARADGVICYHDYAAIGVVMELFRRRARVPEQMGVAGFYNMPIGESFSIGLTTYAFPALTVAQRAVDLMRWRLAVPEAPPVKLVVPGSLIVRDSTDPTAVG